MSSSSPEAWLVHQNKRPHLAVMDNVLHYEDKGYQKNCIADYTEFYILYCAGYIFNDVSLRL